MKMEGHFRKQLFPYSSDADFFGLDEPFCRGDYFLVLAPESS